MQLDFLKKVKKNEIVTFTMVSCFIILVGYYFFFLSPVVSKFLSVFKEVAKVQSVLNEAAFSLKRVPMIKKEIEELRSKAGFYSDKLPREEEFPAVLENLSDMARNTGVKITKILPVKDRTKYFAGDAHSSIYSEQEINIDAQCGYHQLGEFISELENAERFMEVSDITVEAGRVNPKRHNVQLIVKTFILKGE